MSYVQEVCTTEVFDRLGLPQSLLEDTKLNPLERLLVFGLVSRSALVPHPFHYSDYPDRALSFFVNGKCFSADEPVQRSDGPDRVEIYFDKAATQEEQVSVLLLLQQAVAVFRNEPIGTIPVVKRGSTWR